MKFALLGCDDEALTLARAMPDARRNPLDESAHRIVGCFEIPAEFEKPLRSLAASATFHHEWEGLLHDGLADAVIVAPRRRQEREVDQLRKLAQVVPLVLVQPCCEAIVGFELDMICSDTSLPIVPYVRGLGHPLVDRLRELASGSDLSIGVARQLTFVNTASPPTREDVLYHVARDTALIRKVIGHLTDITASGASIEDTDYRGLSVSYTSEQEIPARWTVESSRDDAWGRMSLIGDAGHAVLEFTATPDQWTLSVEPKGQPAIRECPEYAWPEQELANIVTWIESPKIDLWLDACRDLEVADNIDYSLRRGRKVSLISEAPSEAGTFKGVMAAGGCLLLMLALLAVIGLSMVEGFRYPGRRNEWDRERAERKSAGNQDSPPAAADRPHLLFRIWPAYPLILFLILQTFRTLAKPRQRPGPSDDDEPPPASDAHTDS